MGDRTLLLVDDDASIKSSLTRLFNRNGYHVVHAESGAEGLKILEQQEIGVIISDQRMPSMTGVEFLSEVKERYPNTVRLVLSGYADLNSVTDAINRGAIYKFLMKPWDDDQLCENVNEAFQYFELKKDNEHLAHELKKTNERLSHINEELNAQMLGDAIGETTRLKILQMEKEVLDNLPVGVVGVNQQGVLVIANRVSQHILGQQSPLLVGAKAQEVLPKELHDLLYKDCDKTCTVAVGECEVRVICGRSDGMQDGHGTVLAFMPVTPC